ncbi:MAG: beta-propeller domain-containing protein [Desulfobacterota bacterium]|nr:beta-propeller domain-containing protein [Thermodesulfobacteriota bacterium]
MYLIQRYALFFFLIVCFSLIGCGGNASSPFKHVRTSPKLKPFSSCESLETALKEHLKQEMRVYLEQVRDIRYYGYEGGDKDAPTNEGDNREEGVDYSGTNNQETGVDEGDIVKTDGYALYVLSGTTLQVLGIPEFGQLTQESSLKIEGQPLQLLIYKQRSGGRAVRAVVFSSVWTDMLAKDHPLMSALISGRTLYGGALDGVYPCYGLTKLTVIDLTDISAPTVIREVYVEGYYQTSRAIGSVIRMVSYAWMDIAGLRYWPEIPEEYYSSDNQTWRDRVWQEAIQKTVDYNNALIDSATLYDLVPRMYEMVEDGQVIIYDPASTMCAQFTIAQDGMSRGFTSLLSLDLADDAAALDSDLIVSTWSTVYASAQSLLIAEPAQDWWWYWNNTTYDEATNIHRFALDPEGTAQYTGSGRVDGTIENQFCLSEHNGVVRVAATTGTWRRWWEQNQEPPETHIFVLQHGDNATLNVTGTVSGIAKGEHLWAARFIGEKAYLVTFRNTDPLWTVDLSDPAQPKVIGKLEVPGVATYIHPLDDAHLLTVGYGGDDQGLDGSIHVALFDVHDMSSPQLIDTHALHAVDEDNQTSSWGWTEALYEHKAFQYWPQKKMLAIPLSASKFIDRGAEGVVYEYVSTLRLISVDAMSGFTTYGTIDHSLFFNSEGLSYCWCYHDIRRAIFMGNFIYALSERGVTAHNLDSMKQTASLSLPGTECQAMKQYGLRNGIANTILERHAGNIYAERGKYR